MSDGGPFRISVDQDVCIGSATCVSSAPTVFHLNETNRAEVIEGAAVTLAVALDAAADCPSEAISVIRLDPV